MCPQSITLTTPSPQAGAGEETLPPASATPRSRGGRGFSPWQQHPPRNTSQTGHRGPTRAPPWPVPACLPPPARPGVSHCCPAPRQPCAPRVGHGWTPRCRNHHRWVEPGGAGGVALGTGVRGVRSWGRSGLVLRPVPMAWPELSHRPGIPRPTPAVPGPLSPAPLGRAERGQEMAAGPCPQKAGGEGGAGERWGGGVPACHPVGGPTVPTRVAVGTDPAGGTSPKPRGDALG